MSDKSSRWSMTVYEGQWNLLEQMPPEVAEWGWQDEVCPDTGRKHRQGYLRTKSQVRFSALKKILPGVHLEVAKNWAALKEYCSKIETAVEGTQVHQQSNIPSKYTYAEEIAKRLCTRARDEGWTLSQMLDEVKELALTDIACGRQGIEWIIIDPNWKLMWKETGMATLVRAQRQIDRQTEDEIVALSEETNSRRVQEVVELLYPVEYNNAPPSPPLPQGQEGQESP